MRRIVLALLFATGSTAASAAGAADAPNDARVQTTAALDGATKVVCRYMVHEGIIIRRPECHTVHEWDAILTNRQREIREFQHRSYVVPK